MKQFLGILLIAFFVDNSRADICADNNLALGTHIRNPADCSQFFICDVLGAVLFQCSPPTVFNSLHLGCDWPENVNCNSVVPAPPSPICNNLPLGTHIRNPNNCGEFFICDHSGPVRFQCNPPLVFNPAHSGCDWPQNVNDCPASAAVPPPAPQAPMPPQAPTQSPMPVPNPPQGGTPNPACVGNIVYLPHPTSCNLFLTCIRGFSVELSCPPRLTWNTAGNTCEFVANNNCAGGGGDGGGGGGGGGDQGRPDELLPNSCPAVDDVNNPVFLPHPTNNSQFLACSRGTALVISCPAMLVWNTNVSACVLS